MKPKLYEKYYKRGFDHFIYKDVMGLSKPNKNTKLFYFTLIVGIIGIAFIV